MELTKLSINRPLTMIMIIMTIVVMGRQGYTRLQVDRMPSVDIPFVTVTVVYPGASPEDVADMVLEEIEDAVAGVSGIDEISSTANENFGLVIIQFNEGVDGNQAAIDISRKIDAIRSQLPEDAEDPTIIKADFNATSVMQILVSGQQGQDVLYRIAQDDLKPRLQAVEGVASVSVSGGREREVHVETDPIKLAAYELSLGAIQQALRSENANVPAGSVDFGNQKHAIRSIGEFTGVDEIKDIIVAGGPIINQASGKNNDGPVYLKDVALVSESFAKPKTVVRYNGQEGVLIDITKTSDANAIEVSENIKNEMGLFEEDLPAGASLDIITDTSNYTRESIAAVQEDLLLAILITGLVILVFLHSPVSSFIVMLSVPTSLIATFLAMWAFGFTLNTMTLIALTLVIGILVDDSIVVLENVERHIKMGKTPRQAAIDGRAEIGPATITITLVVVVVFLPVALVSGIIGQFLFEYGITISVATLVSLLVSYTLAPMLAALWLHNENAPKKAPTGLVKWAGFLFKPITWTWAQFVRVWEAGFTALANIYAMLLRWSLKNIVTQFVIVAIAAAALYGGILLVSNGLIASEMLPQEDDGEIKIEIERPAGTNLAATDRAASRVEQAMVQQVPEVAKIITNVGGTGGGFDLGAGSPNKSTIIAVLVNKESRQRSTVEIVEALRPALKNVPSADIAVSLNASMGGGSAIEFKLLGPDYDTLIDLSEQAAAIAATVPGAVDVRVNGGDRPPETRVVLDRRRTKDMKQSPAQVGSTLRAAINGTKVGALDTPATGKLDIVLQMNEQTRTDPQKLLAMPVGYVDGEVVYLSQIANVEDSQAPGTITRSNRQPSITIQLGASGRGAGDITNDIEAALNAQLNMPAGYKFQLAGQTEMQRESFADLGSALVLSILLIYMLLVALYQSFMQPLAIMFTMPMGLVGAFLGLWLTGNSLNIMSILGIIMLTGLVTKNAVLLIDFTNQLRDEGYDIKHALVESGRLRLRPILMTVLSLVLALLPLLFSNTAGTEMRAPIAAVIVGGLSFSTLLTFFLVPVVYNFFEWLSATSTSVVRRALGLQKRTAAGSGTDKGQQGPTPAPQAGA